MRRRREILRFCSETQHKTYFNWSCNVVLFQGFTRRLQFWTEGDREVKAATER